MLDRIKVLYKSKQRRRSDVLQTQKILNFIQRAYGGATVGGCFVGRRFKIELRRLPPINLGQRPGEQSYSVT
jgi:hypothetical protein